jgi:hypothetical protein
MVEFNPQGRRAGIEEREDTIRRPYSKVEPAGAVSSGAETRHAADVRPRPDAAYIPPEELREPTIGRTIDRTTPATYGREGRDSRSLVDLFRELIDEGRAMLRQELLLAKVELKQNVRAMGRHAAMIAAGGAVAYAGLLAIVGALALGAFVLLTWAGLSAGISLWLGPLLVGVIVAIVGYAMLRSGMNRIQNDDLVPERTTQSMRENAEWMQERMK